MASPNEKPRWTPPADKWAPRAPPQGGNLLMPPWIPPAARPLVFTNAKVVRVEDNKVDEGMTVVIENGEFKHISSSLKEADYPKGSRVVDLKGLYLCPGLVDGHVHINFCDGMIDPWVDGHLRATYTLKCMLARGFTTVRDVGGADVFQKEAIAQWLTPGPRLFQGGNLLSQTGGHGDMRQRQDPTERSCCPVSAGFNTIADGVDGVTFAARELMRKGADHIKICASGGVASPTDKLEGNQYTAEEISAIVGVANDMGATLVASHAYTVPAIRRAIENGVRSIEHGNLIDEDTAKLMAEKDVFLTPTLVVYNAMGRPPWNSKMPQTTREKNAQVLEAGKNALLMADKAGVTICFGSDLIIGMGYLQSEEFTIRHSIIASHKVLLQATVNGAKLVGDAKIGKIKEGCYADCLVLPANPLEDVRVLDTGAKGIWGVIKEGRVVVARDEFEEGIREFGGLDVNLDIPEAK